MSAKDVAKPQVKQEDDKESGAQPTGNSKQADGAVQNKPTTATSNAANNVKDAKVGSCNIFNTLYFFCVWIYNAICLQLA